MICPLKHPTPKFKVNFLNERKMQVRAGSEGRKDFIMKNSSDNKKYTPKWEHPGTLPCNKSLQSLESLRPLNSWEIPNARSWELGYNDVILHLWANHNLRSSVFLSTPSWGVTGKATSWFVYTELSGPFIFHYETMWNGPVSEHDQIMWMTIIRM